MSIHHSPFFISPGEIFGLAVGLLAARARTGVWPERAVLLRYFDGPAQPPDVAVVSDHLSADDVFEVALIVDAQTGNVKRDA